MDKNKIKSHLHSYLVEAEKEPLGKIQTDKVQKQEKTVNNDYYKEVTKKMSDYDKATTDDADSIKSGDLEKTESGEMDVNPNGMDQIQYDNDPDKKFKDRAIEALEGSSKMGNKTYEGKWNPETGAGNGNTEEVWGASGGKHTGKEIVKSAKAVSKKDAKTQEDAVSYVPSPKKTKLATENKQSNNEIIKETSKMKRLKFKQPFNGVGKALTLIPEGYKVDNKVFEMTDGNENYKIRWEGTLKEGQAIILTASDKNMMNEDIQHMKHLMGFKAANTLGTPTAKERVTENSTFRDIMNLTNKLFEGKEEGDKKPIRETAFAGHGFTSEANIEKVAPAVSENEEVEEVTESKGEKPNEGGEASKIGKTADGDPRGAGHDKHIMEEDDLLEGFDTPKIFKLSESELSAGTDLGTKIGKTAAGDPRGAGHDDHIMEEEEELTEGQLTEGNVNDEASFRAELEQLVAAGGKRQKGTIDDLIGLAAQNKFKGFLSMKAGYIMWKPAAGKFASFMGRLGAGTGGQTSGQ